MTIAAKIGASILAPFMAFGGMGHAAPLAALPVQDTSSCIAISHNLSFRSTDRSTDGDVTRLQTFLHDKGYLKNNASGSFGLNTFQAVKTYQKANNIPPTGQVRGDTRTLINNERCGGTSSSPLSVTGIDGPTSLNVGSEGTWTVHVAYASTTTNLHYSVTWGDEAARMMLASTDTSTSSATFTHAYGSVGTYAPTFTVTDDQGRTVSKTAASVHVGTVSVAHIDSLTPKSGAGNTTVTIKGSGFTSDSIVNFGSTTVSAITFTNSKALSFVVPTVATGTYPVSVKNANGTSNELSFTVTKPAGYLSINGVDAPVRLETNQNGTWTVHVNTASTGTLHYSVTWGDENLMVRAMSALSIPMTQTSGSFTHAYSQQGQYEPTFTVTDDQGHTVSAHATVTVVNPS